MRAALKVSTNFLDFLDSKTVAHFFLYAEWDGH